MKFKMSVSAVFFLFMFIFVSLVTGTGSYADSSISRSLEVDYEAARTKPCNYCHGEHGARGDVDGLLNEDEEHYNQYIEDDEGGDSSVFAVDQPERKCPRSRSW